MHGVPAPRQPKGVHPRAAADIEHRRRLPREPTLEQLLRAHPYDGAIALRLARLRADRGAGLEVTAPLARRAVRFGGGEEAEALLRQLEPATGELAAGATPAGAKTP